MSEKPNNPSPDNEQWDDDALEKRLEEIAPSNDQFEVPKRKTVTSIAPRGASKSPETDKISLESMRRIDDGEQKQDKVRKKKRRRSSKSRSSDSEGEWGKKKSEEPFRVWILAGFAVILIVGVSIYAVQKINKQSASGRSVGKVVDGLDDFDNDKISEPVEEPVALDPAKVVPDSKEWFEIQSGTLTTKMSRLLKEIGDGRNLVVLKANLRAPEVSLALISQSAENIFLPAPELDRIEDWTLSVDEVDGKAFGIFGGKRKNGDRFSYYLTGENGGLKLDWQASAMHSSKPLAKILDDRDGNAHSVRCILKKGHVYIDGFSEEEWSCWEVHSGEGDIVLWGYVPKGGDRDVEFKKWLNYGQFLMPLLDEMKARVVVKSAGSGKYPKIFEITDIVGREWVDSAK